MAGVTREMLFAADVFSFLARQYNIVDCSLPFFSEHLNMKSDFTDDIGDAILLLSYSYRFAFRKHILEVLPIISCSDNIPLFFNNCFFDGMNEYVRPAMRCLRATYKMILQKYYSPLFEWHELQQLASELAIGYKYLKPIIRREHPFKPTRFLDSFTATHSGCETDFPAKTKTQKDEASIESSSDSEASFPANYRHFPEDIKHNRIPTESSATSDARSLDSNSESKTFITEDLKLPPSPSRNIPLHFTMLPNETITQTSLATTNCVPSSESERKECKPSQVKMSASGDYVFPFKSVEESIDLASEHICESAITYEEVCFDMETDALLNEVHLGVDKTEHNSGEADSETTKSSQAGVESDLESSFENSKSANVNGKSQSNKPWQKKKRTKKNKRFKKIKK